MAYLFMLFKCVLKTASMDIDIRVNIYYIICYLYTLQFCMKIKAFIKKVEYNVGFCLYVKVLNSECVLFWRKTFNIVPRELKYFNHLNLIHNCRWLHGFDIKTDKLRWIKIKHTQMSNEVLVLRTTSVPNWHSVE